MQTIVKNQEPSSFNEWKMIQLPHDWSINCQGKSSSFWEKLKKFEKGVFKEIQESLLREQGFLCCYCSTEIGLHDPENKKCSISIEHLKAKDTNCELTFDYRNLLASCQWTGNCNLKRKNTPLRKLNPLNEEIVKQLYFKKDKKNFILTSDDEDLTADIETLNLNHSDLSKTRKEIFTELKLNINESFENCKDEEEQKKALQLLYEKYSQKDADTGKFIPYSSFRIWVLKSKFPKMFP